MLVVGQFLTHAGNDKQQVVPMFERMTSLPEDPPALVPIFLECINMTTALHRFLPY